MKWLIGLFVALAALAGFAWYFVLDGSAPARAEGTFDLAAYRALVASDAPVTLPTEVRVEIVGGAPRPALAVQAGAMGQREIVYSSFQILAPGGGAIIDAPVDRALGEAMTGKGFSFSDTAYARVTAAMSGAATIVVTHEHPDHIAAIARHPQPASIAPQLRLTPLQRDALAPLAQDGGLDPAIADAPTLSLAGPTRIAPGIVMVPAAGHSPGSVLLYVRTAAREYLFIGDVAWAMSNIRDLRGRPRFLRWIVRGVDPDRPAVLRQLRALHDIAAAEPGLVIIPAHDAVYLRELVGQSILSEGFVEPGAAPLDPAPGAPQPSP